MLYLTNLQVVPKIPITVLLQLAECAKAYKQKRIYMCGYPKQKLFIFCLGEDVDVDIFGVTVVIIVVVILFDSLVVFAY